MVSAKQAPAAKAKSSTTQNPDKSHHDKSAAGKKAASPEPNAPEVAAIAATVVDAVKAAEQAADADDVMQDATKTQSKSKSRKSRTVSLRHAEPADAIDRNGLYTALWLMHWSVRLVCCAFLLFPHAFAPVFTFSCRFDESPRASESSPRRERSGAPKRAERAEVRTRSERRGGDE